MKNFKYIIPLILPLLLAGCGNTDRPQDSSSESHFYEDMKDREKDAEYIYDYLIYVANHGDYTLSYSMEGVDCFDLFNKDYYYASILQSGGMLLPYVEKEDEDILYRFDLNQNNVDILLPETSGGTYVSSVNEISYFSLFTDKTQSRYNLKSGAIKKAADGSFYTDNAMANLVFCASVGYISLAQNNLIQDTTFSILENGDLAFTINALSMDSSGDYSEAVITKATFSNVDCSKLEAVEAFRSSYASRESLSEDAAKVLQGETLSAHNVISLHEGNEEPVEYATSDVGISSTQLSVRSQEKGHEQVYAHFFENQNGAAKIIGINGHNEVIVENSDEEGEDIQWKELGWPKDIFSAKAFRKIKDNTYRYLGLDAEGFFYSYSYVNFDMAIKTLDLVVENGTLKEMDATFYRSVSDIDSSYFYYTVKTTFDSKANFSRPAPYEAKADDANQKKVENAFKGLKQGSSYVATIEDYGSLTSSVTRMTLADNILYFEVYNPVTTEVSKRHGFVEKDGKVIPFNVSRDATSNRLVAVTSGKCIEGDTLDNHIGFSASPLIFDINSKNQIVPKPEVLSVADALITGEGGAYMIPSTLTMQLDENSRVLNINYRYEAPSEYGLGSVKGYDQISFKDYGTASLAPNLTLSINGLTPME
ncbi:MAG: hypothetical protein PUI76_07020 [Mollicutes bacterium]|nr:hypothetical protein [Mollicutes bacterium]